MSLTESQLVQAIAQQMHVEKKDVEDTQARLAYENAKDEV